MKSAILLVAILCPTALASEENYSTITSMTLVCQPSKPFAETTVQVKTGGPENDRRISLLRVSNKDFDVAFPREALADLAMPMLETLRLSTEPGYDPKPWMYVTFRLGNPKPGAAWDFPTVYLKINDGKFVGRSLKRKVGDQIRYDDLPVAVPKGAAIDPKIEIAPATQPTSYHAYWLTSTDPNVREYIDLLISKRPIQELGDMKLAAPAAPADATAIVLTTYAKDSIWNMGDPFRAVESVAIDKQAATVLINGKQYRFAPATLKEVVGLLEKPEGTIRIHRMRGPLAGAEEFSEELLRRLKKQLVAEATTRPGVVAADPIDRLVTRLSSDPLWQNGTSPVITLPEDASTEQVVSEVFKMTGFDQGRVTKHRIVNVKQVQIRGSLPDRYTAALVETNLGQKIVLFRHGGGGLGCWSRVYDVEAPPVTTQPAKAAG